LKTYEFIKKSLEKNNFIILGSDWDFNKFYFKIKKEKLSNHVTRRGPPINKKTNYNKFKKKHSKTFIENGIIYAKLKRKYHDPKKLLKDLLKEKYVKERIKSIKFIRVRY
jgi:hypothetical protein